MKQKRMKSILFTTLLCAAFAACSDDAKEDKENINPKEQWSATLQGNGEILGAYPDLFSNYWEYTYNKTEYPDVALRIEGHFPHARYFSFSFYDDETGSAIGGINDYEIQPDDADENPFVVTSANENRFTLYVVPASMDESQVAKLPSGNVRRVAAGVNRLAICIRHYLGTDMNGEKDEYGGVELPVIKGIDIHSLEEIEAPERTQSNIDKVTGKSFTQKSDDNRDVPFLLAPCGEYYPNNSTSYLYARTRLDADSVLIFSFIPVPIPQKVEAYENAKARYWSICLGAASNTRSYYSVYDQAANTQEDEKTSFIICRKQNSGLEAIKSKVDSLNQSGGHWNLFIWDSEKTDIDGKPIGDIIAIMYRNILPNKDWEHSIARMTPTNYADEEGEPLEKVTDPDKQLAHQALGDYGPYGFKYATSDFLDEKFKEETY